MLKVSAHPPLSQMADAVNFDSTLGRESIARASGLINVPTLVKTNNVDAELGHLLEYIYD